MNAEIDWFKTLAPVVFPSAVIERALEQESIAHLYHGGAVTHRYTPHCAESVINVCARFVAAVLSSGGARCSSCDTSYMPTFTPISAAS